MGEEHRAGGEHGGSTVKSGREQDSKGVWWLELNGVDRGD